MTSLVVALPTERAMQNLKNKVCVVTGAASGLGEACVFALALAGARVAMVDRDTDALERLAHSGPDSLSAKAFVCDVANPEQVAEACAEIESELGPVSVLVNCAGVNVPDRHFDKLTPNAWAKIVEVNLTGTFNWVHAVLPSMRRRRQGTVINVSSWAGKYAAFFTGPAYNASKRAVIALTESINLEEGANSIRATVVVPEAMATAMIRRSPVRPSDDELDRMLQAEDVASLITYVAGLPPHICVNELVVSPTFNRSLLGGYETALKRS